MLLGWCAVGVGVGVYAPEVPHEGQPGQAREDGEDDERDERAGEGQDGRQARGDDDDEARAVDERQHGHDHLGFWVLVVWIGWFMRLSVCVCGAD